MGDDSVGVSSQDTPERSEIQTCCRCEATEGLRQCQGGECQHMSCMRHKYWVARDQVSSHWCCQCCFPTTVKCYQCQRNATQVLLFNCDHFGCTNHACGVHSEWSVIDGKVKCRSCAPQIGS
eukprot:2298255-Amphidinium_carterae.1